MSERSGGWHCPRHWVASDRIQRRCCAGRRGLWFRGDFCTEVNNQSVGTAQLMGLATRHIKVGTWVADIYLRVPYLCAKSAILTADATGGVSILGLGVSHQPVNRALGIDMPDPMGALRKYTLEVANWLRGEGPATYLTQQPAPHPVPIYLAALTSQNVELAGEPSRWRDAPVVVGRADCAQPGLDSSAVAANPVGAPSWT